MQSLDSKGYIGTMERDGNKEAIDSLLFAFCMGFMIVVLMSAPRGAINLF